MIKKWALYIFFLLTTIYISGQCPQLLDGQGNYSNYPYWISCTGGNFTVFIQPDIPVGNYTINWGDGSPNDNGPNIIPPGFVSHTYAATTDTFVVTLTDNSNGCVINGVVVMEQTPSASIQIPLGSPVYGCAPASFDFQNSSTNISPTTVFTWDFGDGSPIQTYDYTNWNQIISHTYQPGTVNCDVAVTLTAENYCNQGNPSSNTYFPIQVWDIDQAQITASNTFLCYPDTIVYFENTTIRNCYANGNTAQRYELWNFGNYWGQGYDSIIGWRPWGPPNWGQFPIAYPGIGTYNVMLVDSSYCGRDTAYITINIVPPPTANMFPDNDTICAGQSINFTNTSTGGGNSFDWNFGDGTGWTTTGPGNVAHTYNFPGDYTVTLVANITGGTASCTDTITTNIHVLPSPTANFNFNNNNGCDTLTVTFSDFSSVDVISWNWVFGNGNTSTLQNPPSQFYNAPGNYIVQLTVTNNNGCQNTQSQTINVFQTPTPLFTPTSVCEGSLATFTDQSTSSPGDPIISWFWDFGDGNSSTVQNPTHTYSPAGTYNMILTVNTAYCSASDTVPITVENKPTASFTPSTNAGCADLTVNFTNSSSANAVNFFWDFGDGDSSTTANPSHVFLNNSSNDTIYNVTLYAYTLFGCVDSITIPITVFANPNAQFTHNATLDCAPLVVDFTNTTTGAVSYQWDFGDGSPIDVATNPSHTYQNTTLFITNYTVTLIAQSSNGCTDTSQQTITVYPEPQFGFSTNPDSGCSPLTVNFPSVIGAVSYQWDFGDGNTGTGPTPSHTYVNTTTNNVTYTVQLIAMSPFGCSDTTYGTVLVFPNPSAQFTVDTNIGCQPLNVNLTNLSTGGSTYYWDYGDGNYDTTLIANLSHQYVNSTSNPINYPITLIAETDKGCKDTATSNVLVYPVVQADFVHDTGACNPVNVNFIDNSIGALNYTWDFGDGSTLNNNSNPSHLYNFSLNYDTTFNISLIVESQYGCFDTAFSSITIFATPIANFSVLPQTQTYPSVNVGFTNNSSIGNWQYSWNFGDTTFSNLQNPPNHSYPTWGTYTVQLVVSGAVCSDTAYQTVTINPPVPIADFLGPATGCRPLDVTFINNSQYADTYLWDFGDGGTSTQTNPTYTYYNPGTYTVTLTAIGQGGKDTMVQNQIIEVYPVPNAFFTTNKLVVYIPNDPLLLYNLSNNASTYFWDFGDGTTSTDENPEHFYQTEGVYNILLIAENQYGCRDTFILNNAVIAETEGGIQVPNAFTPSETGGNGGVITPGAFDNNVFHPLVKGASEYELNIFNKWGELLFVSENVNIGWDGYYKNELCKQDVYIYKIKVTFIDGRKETLVGDVTLLR